MADPTTPTTPTTPPDPATTAATTAAINEQTTAVGNLTSATNTQSAAYRSLNSVSDLVQSSMANIESVANSVGVSMGNITSLTNEQIEKFGLLSAAFVNAREAFVNFSNVDYSGLTTFSAQIKHIGDALSNVPAEKMAESLGSLGNVLLKSGVSQSTWTATLGKGKEAVLELATNVFKHADNMLRAQTAYVQMAARTGQLGDVTKAAGKDFKDLGTILESQQTMLRNTREATGLTADQTERWYNQLGLIPGALNSVVNVSEKDGRTMSMLTAVIQTAVGSGRAQEDVMRDLNIAFKDYGLVGEKALQFSVRMSDVSTRLKAPIEDVTTALRGSADAFKMFATGQDAASKASEGLANTLNTYGKALESTGLSASASVEIASQMTNQVGRLSIAQQAFVSQQTGGPGGLMGGYRIEQRLQQGDTAGVVQDVMKTLERQMGRLVSVDEAARSEAAASQLTKQTAMLQSLLGPIAKDRQTAEKLIQGMINQQKGVPDALANALKPTGVQDAAKQGLDLQQKSYSELTMISNTLEQIRDLGDTAAGRVVGRMTAGGVNQPTTGTSGVLSMNLADRARAARETGGAQVAAFTRGIETGKVKETAGLDYGAALHTTLTGIKDMPVALRSTFDTIKSAFSRGDKESADKQEQMLAEFVAARKTLDTAKNIAGPASGTVLPSEQVGAAARASIAARPPGATTPAGTTTSQGPGANIAGVPQTINIVGKFTIDCPTCGRPHDVTDNAMVTPAQFNR